MFTNSSLSFVSFGVFGTFWIDSWLDRKDIGVVVAFDLVDNCLELASLEFQKINSWASDSLLAAQIFVTWPRPYFVWHDLAVKNCGQTCPLLFNDYNDEIQLLFRRDAIE